MGREQNKKGLDEINRNHDEKQNNGERMGIIRKI